VLIATSQRGFGPSLLRSTVFLERRLRLHLMDRDRLRFDSRFAPAAKASPFVHVYASLRGSFQLGAAAPTTGPQAYVLADNEFDRVGDGALTFRSWGAPATIIELRLPAADVRRPIGLRHGRLTRPAASWDAYAALAAPNESADGVIAAARLHQLIVSLGDAGVVSPDLVASVVPVEPERFERLWSVIRPLYATYATSASLKQIADASGLSLRQLGRDLTELTRTFGLFGGGFREAARVLRLRAAVLLLSAPEAAASEVARAVGYGSLDAMGRAFRDASLPAPSAIQAHVRYRDEP
jgi:AraC-like DNA-binding protein